MSILLTNVDQISLETEFSIVICRPNGDKWQSKTLFPAIFDPHSSTVKSVFDCRLPGVILWIWKLSRGFMPKCQNHSVALLM